jgi:hypothetical protein
MQVHYVFSKFSLIVISGLAVSLLGSPCLLGQQEGAVPARSAGRGAEAADAMKAAAAVPTPHTLDGHPDLTGFWAGGAFGGPGGGATAKVAFDGSKPVVDLSEEEETARDLSGVAQRKADTAARPSYKPQYVAKAEENFDKAALLDPSFQCRPDGVPRLGAPAEINQTPAAVYFLYNNGSYRIVPTDGRQHDPSADAMPNGDAVGHWEGDTLVVDVTNFDPDTWLDADGSFHDKSMHVIERLTRQGNTLRYEVTVDDPTMFAKPWRPNPRTLMLGKSSQHVAEPYPCVELDRSGNHLADNQRH